MKLIDEEQSYSNGYNAGMSKAVHEIAELTTALRECVVALESKWAANWDGHYSRRGITKEYAQKVSEEITNATSRAKAILERYK